MAQYTKAQLVSASNATYFTNTSGGISASAVRDLNDSWISSSALLSGSNTFIGSQIISGNLDISGTITASLQTGYLYVGDSSGKTQAVATSSIIANTDTSSLLVTASFASTNITFTKGDASQFSLPGFATTGSNTFRGNQTLVSSSISIQGSGNITLPNGFSLTANAGDVTNLSATSTIQLITEPPAGPGGEGNSIKFINRVSGSIIQFDNQQAGAGNPINFIGGASQFTLIVASGSTGTLNINAAGGIDASNSAFTSSLANGFTYVGNASNVSTLVATSSFGTSINTGSFATTGSNTFTGVNTFNERTNLQGINVYTGSASGIYIGDRTNFAPTTAGNIPGNQHTVVGQGALGQFGNGDLNAAFGPNTLANLVSGSSNLAMGAFAGLGLINGNTNTFIGDQAGNGMKGGDNNFFLGSSAGNNFRTGSFNVMIGLNTQGNLATGSGNLFIGNQNVQTKIANNVDNQFAVAYGTDLTPRKLFFKSGSEADNLGLYGGLEVENTFTASLAQGFTYVGNASGRTTLVATSSFGGGTTYINPTLNPYSGSLILVANTFTSSSFAHISASANGQVNLVFKNNNNTADTIISGSNNIFVNPTAPTAGFKRYVGGSGNIALNGSNVPQISGSMGFSPVMNNNYFGGINTTVNMRGPVSSSTYTISGNQIVGSVSIGQTAGALTAEKLTSGLNLNNNSIAGVLNITANQTALTGSTTVFSSNILNGGATLTLSSSAASLNNNIINDVGFILTNQFFSSSAGLGTVPINRNNIGGQGNSIIITGGQPSGTTTANSISDNIIFGGANRIFIDVANSRVSGSTSYQNAIRNGLIGNNLIVSGSSLLGDLSSQGSVFVGRFNADDSIRNKTSDIIFAVGTGTSVSNRKTGFLIDSGSNTFFEGVVNISGSLLVNGVAPAVINTGSFATTGSNSFIGNQTITGSLTVTGNSIFTGSINALTLTRGSGNNNVGIGVNILQNAVSGGNVALGNDTLRDNTSGTDNVALGNSALLSNISGDRNMAIGSNTLDSNTTGTLNVAIGNATLAGLVDGNANVGIGFEALKNQTTSNDNVGIGKQTLNQNISGSGNIAFGSKAGYHETGSGNFYVNNTEYGSINADRSGSLMWGTMNITTANQTLQINATTNITNDLIVSSFTTLASVSSSLNFADDTAAAAGGVPFGGLYRNGNFVMIRLT